MTRYFQVLANKLFRRRIAASWVCATLIAAYAGPFGSFDEYPAVERVLYWALIVGISIVLAYAVRVVLWAKLPKLSYAGSEAAATVIFSLLFTPVAWVITTAWIGGAEKMPFSIFGLFGFVLLVAMSISIFIAVLVPGAPVRVDGFAPLDPPPPSPLMKRLPPEQRGKLEHICAADHYVQVYTDRGDARVLMRFADALKELGDADGLQVHRSYWVARDAVFQMRLCEGRLILLLQSGRQVPVSRKYRDLAEMEFAKRRAPASGSPD